MVLSATLAILCITMLIVSLVVEYFNTDKIMYDMALRAAPHQVCDSILIVGIDKKSLQKHGSWPWPRSRLARLFSQIENSSPRIIAPAILFPRRALPRQNDSLASSFASASTLALPFRIQSIRAGPSTEQAAAGAQQTIARYACTIDSVASRQRINFYHAQYINPPDSLFLAHAGHSGFLNVPTPARSGTVREIIHVLRIGTHVFPSFGLAAAAAFKGIGPDSLRVDPSKGIHLGDEFVPLSDYAGSLFLHFRGPAGSVATVSASNVLEGNIDSSKIKDKLVFIGITNPLAIAGFHDTPYDSDVSATEIWATAAADLLQNAWIKKPAPVLVVLNILIVLIIFPGCAVVGTKPISKALRVALAIILVSLSIALCFWIMRTQQFFWDPTHHLIALVFLLAFLFGFRNTSRTSLLHILDIEPRRYGDKDVFEPSQLKTDSSSLLGTSTISYVMKNCTIPEFADETTQVSVGDNEENTTREPVLEAIENINTISDGKLITFLGSGGMADVFLLWKPELEVARAVKILKPDIDDNLALRFTTESRILSNLNHPNIVQCYNVGKWNSLPFMEMEYVHGAPMDTVLQECRIFSVGQATAIALLICRALHYAHNQVVNVYGKTYRGIIHRDLKPANIMLSRAGRIKLTDFGVARPTEVSLDTNSPGTVVGTLPYLAPEQVQGGVVTHRSDIYSLGITLYEFLTGKKALPQRDPDALIHAKINGEISRIPQSSLIPRHLADVIHRAIALKPMHRFDSARQMHEALYEVYNNVVEPGDNLSETEKLAKRYWGY